MDRKQKIVYIVTVQKSGFLNQRIGKMLLLRSHYDRLILVCSGRKTRCIGDVWEIRHSMNPTGVLRKLGLQPLKVALDKWLYFPSTQVLFVKAVQRVLSTSIGKQLESGAEITVVTCVPDHSLCLLGMSLKKKFPDLRWVVDWQDLWSHDPYYLMRIPRLYRGRLRRIEKQVLQSCDMNVTTNPLAEKVLAYDYHVPKQRVTSIYHPIAGDMNAAGTTQHDAKRDKVCMAFLGNLFKPPKVPGDKVLQALRYVRQRGVNAELHLYGELPAVYQKETATSGVKQHCFIRGKDALASLRRHDFLLLVLEDLPSCRIITHAKLPQYLLAGRPIIGIVPQQSAVAEVLRETGSGWIIPAEKDWGRELYRILSGYLAGQDLPQRNEAALQKFSWQSLAPRWLEIL